MATKKEATKQKILKAAIKLISSQGFNATSTALIAKESGLSETIIFKYFGDKKSLLTEIGQLAIDQIYVNLSLIPLAQTVEASKNYSSREFFKSILRERLAFVEKNSELIKILFLEMQYNENMFALFKKMVFPRIGELVENVIDILQVKIGFTKERAKTSFQILMHTLIGLMIQKFIFQIDWPPQKIEQTMDNVFDVIECYAREQKTHS